MSRLSPSLDESRDFRLLGRVVRTVPIGKDGSVQVVHVGLPPDFARPLSQDPHSLAAGKAPAFEALANAKKPAKNDAAEQANDDGHKSDAQQRGE
jgi:hypothetical protein